MRTMRFSARAALEMVNNFALEPITGEELKAIIQRPVQKEDIPVFLPQTQYDPRDMRAAIGHVFPELAKALTDGSYQGLYGGRPPIITSYYKKGGTGKSTVTTGLGVALARMGFRVLMIDADDQATLSDLLGVDTDSKDLFTLANYLLDRRPPAPKDHVLSIYENADLDLIPADIELSCFDEEALPRTSREFIFYNFINTNNYFLKKYDFIFVDNAPGSTLLQFNSLIPSDMLLCVVTLDVTSLKSMRLMNKHLERIKELHVPVPRKKIQIIINRYTESQRHNRQGLDIVKDIYGGQIMPVVVPNYIGAARQGDIAGQSVSIVEGEPSSVIAKALMKLALLLVDNLAIRPLKLPVPPAFKDIAL